MVMTRRLNLLTSLNYEHVVIGNAENIKILEEIDCLYLWNIFEATRLAIHSRNIKEIKNQILHPKAINNISVNCCTGINKLHEFILLASDLRNHIGNSCQRLIISSTLQKQSEAYTEGDYECYHLKQHKSFVSCFKVMR
ncbi:CLUMA_CG005783, isoform A [Clunio marinus]|uniref:CLUMA_CG005783, isoform A n=1 Tax=Clunio marinus TaxID=568069 RepID=A0A1J1HW47_9DIPT|nr:CLUMA_CG005783, isoform A [Clunio marinus]